MSDSSNELNTLTVSRLFELENILAAQMKEIGCRFRTAPARIQKRFNMLSQTELSAVAENLDQYSTMLRLAVDEGVDPWDDNKFLQISMKQLRLSFPQDFCKVVRSDHVVEAYDMNRRQIYRNLRFMEISNYSLLEVLTYDWPMLFHRDNEVTNMIIKQAEQNMWAENAVISSGIPRHYIRELLSDEPQICEVQQEYFAPLFAGPNQPGGILVASAASPLGVDKSVDHNNIAFLN